VVQTWCTPLCQDVEIARFLGGRSSLPTPQEATAPWNRAGADRGLIGGALGALVRVVGSGPDGMPHGVSGPCHECVSQACGALPAPLDPGCIAAWCRHGRHARLGLEGIGGGGAVTQCAAGAEQARGQDRPSTWQGGTPGAVGRAPGAGRDGRLDVCDRWQAAPELGDERLHPEDMRGDDALLSRPGRRTLEGLEALIDAVGIAHVVGAAAGLPGEGAACTLGGVEGRPWGEAVTDARGVVVVTPWQGVREGVLQRSGEAVGQAHVVADPTAALCDAWRERTPPGALGEERLQRVPRRAQARERQCRGRGGVCRRPGSDGVAVLGQGNRLDGEQHPEHGVS
jgi:hypothetical protein